MKSYALCCNLMCLEKLMENPKISFLQMPRCDDNLSMQCLWFHLYDIIQGKMLAHKQLMRHTRLGLNVACQWENTERTTKTTTFLKRVNHCLRFRFITPPPPVRITATKVSLQLKQWRRAKQIQTPNEKTFDASNNGWSCLMYGLRAIFSLFLLSALLESVICVLNVPQNFDRNVLWVNEG